VSGASTARRLLVAAPTLLDPNFARAIVFMVEHTDEGALGLVLNRPSGTDVDAVLPEWNVVAAEPARVFVGGPVQLGDAVIGLGRVAAPEPPSEGWEPLLGPVGTVDLGVSPGDAHPRMEAVRIFAGYAGWGPEQLDGELAQGGWFVVDADPADLLTPAPEDLWRRVLRRQGGELAMAANHPGDPTVN
jgi:putative transcriptional regulator